MPSPMGVEHALRTLQTVVPHIKTSRGANGGTRIGSRGRVYSQPSQNRSIRLPRS